MRGELSVLKCGAQLGVSAGLGDAGARRDAVFIHQFMHHRAILGLLPHVPLAGTRDSNILLTFASGYKVRTKRAVMCNGVGIIATGI